MTTLSDLGRRGCQCYGGCERFFWGVPAFDQHRTGPHGNGRRCMTDVEMAAAGLALDERGVWAWAREIGKPRRKPLFGVAGRARTPGRLKKADGLDGAPVRETVTA